LLEHFESKIYSFKGTQEDEDYDEYEDETNLVVFDKYQLEEDKEIPSIVLKRDASKRVNGNNLPLHHKIYPSSNKGKFMDKTMNLVNVQQKPKKHSLESFKQNESVEIGLINHWCGNRRGFLYCWKLGSTFICHTLKSACKKSRKIPFRGDMVYFRKRFYQRSTVDILCILEDTAIVEYQNTLIPITRDPILLPEDMLLKIIVLIGNTYHSKKQVSSKWDYILSKLYPIFSTQQLTLTMQEEF